MKKLTMTALLSLSSMLVCSLALAEGELRPPPGWGQPAALPRANGQGQAAFKHGGTALILPLNQIMIDTKQPDMFLVSLTYVDAKQDNKLELTFGSMPKLGKNDPNPITGFVVRTKARGASKYSANKTKCDFAISKLTVQEVSGRLSCKGMTDLSGEKATSDVTDVKFDGKLKAQ